MTTQTRTRLFLFFTLLFSVFAGIADLPFVPDKYPFYSVFNKISYRLGLDLQGGAHLVYEADTSRVDPRDRESTISGVRDVIERRVNAFGVSEPIVQTNKSGDTYRVIVELAGVFDVNEAIQQIGKTPLLEFKEQNNEALRPPTSEEQKQLEEENERIRKKAEEVLQRALAGEDFAELAKEYSEDPGSKGSGGDLGYVGRGVFVPEFEKAIFDDLKTGEITPSLVRTEFGYHIIKKEDERQSSSDPLKKEVRARHILFREKTIADIRPAADPWKNTGLTGAQLKRAEVQFDPTTGEPQVGLEFDKEGKELFAELTKRNIGKPIAIFLDGNPLSVPTVQSTITAGRAVITGNFTIPEARELARNLNAGALPVPINLISQQTVGPTLGQVSLEKSLRAGAWGLLLVAIFMVLYYRFAGIIAVIALAIYTVLTLFLFQLFSVTLTLAGIAGFILSIGMAVDANVLIFERMREEIRKKKPIAAAVEAGFQRAWPSIRDSNMSSLITCAILFWFGTSLIQGFAVTLAIGILVSMFSAITLTRGILRQATGKFFERKQWIFT